ncbi:QRFP-like peptide receptor [Branchiostoma floridae]|uniref:QRFP-like peptide receptor n=1 Tax=Branchiostoma floridae TaxID=7739 RepID=A0A9J7MCF9_BRAFL|nr:QRFP-like peptide receptor [Branchiostoma floridae]XP_035698344.1 QRFP-like peptide receptor [Branchiostoma floridae]
MSNLQWDPPLAENASFFTDQWNSSTYPFQDPEFSGAKRPNGSSLVYVGAMAILYDFPEIAIPTLMTYSMTFTFGVTGNAMIIIAVIRFCCLKTATNYLTMSLAVADLLVSLICVPFRTAELFLSYWPLGGVMCKLLSYIRAVTTLASILTLTAISLERWYVVIRPMQARSVCTPGWAYRVIACVWMLSLSLSTPTLYAMRLVGYKWPVGDTIYHCQEKWPQKSLSEIFSVYFATLIFLPMSIMLAAYSSTIYKLWFSTQTIQRDFDSGSCHVCSTLPRQHSPLSLTQSRTDRTTPSSADKSRTTPTSTEVAVTSVSKEGDKTSSNGARRKPSRFLFDRESVERYLEQGNNVPTSHGNAKSYFTKRKKRPSDTTPTPLTARSTASVEAGRRNMRRPVQGKVSNFREIIRERKQVVRMMLTVVLLFLVCWGPHVVLGVLLKFGLVNPFTQEVYAMKIAFRLLSYLNSCLNPFCYNFMSKKFRRSFKRLLPCGCKGS